MFEKDSLAREKERPVRPVAQPLPYPSQTKSNT